MSTYCYETMDCRVTRIVYFVLVYTYCSLFCVVALENNTAEDAFTNEKKLLGSIYNESFHNFESNTPQRKWITQLFHEAETVFEMDSNVNTECKRDFDLYKLHLRNQSVWAVRMMESSEWPSVGIFSGTGAHLGNFEECLTISSYNIKGQYCLADAIYDYPDILQNELVEVPDERISAWEAVLMYEKNPVRVSRKKLNFAMCIPSSCKPTDLKISLNNTLYPLFKNHGLDMTIDVNPTLCKVRKENTYPQGYFIVKWLFAVLFLVVMLSTCLDFRENEAVNRFTDILQCFSLAKNFKKLGKFDPKTDYASLHFVKIFNILFVIYGHRFIYFLGYPKFNPETLEKWYNASSIELIHTNVVDVFFAISGFLCFHFGYSSMVKGGGFSLIFSVLFRWIRLVPVFCIVILYIIYILPYTGEGPMWDYRVMNEVTKCKESWWANLLAINNIVKTDQQCLVISWYISTDIQLAIIGGILLYIFTKNEKIGIYAIGFTLVVSITTTFTVAYINKFHGLLRLYMSLLEEPRNEPEFTNFYIAPYVRAGPYLIGVIAAVAVKLLKDREFKLTNKQIYLISFLSILISEGSQYYGCLFYNFNRPYNRFESALFASLNRSLFVFTYAVHIFLYFTSGLGLKVWVPLGRLTYSVFLINTVIQLYHASIQKQPMPLSKLNLLWLALGDAVWSYVIGLILHLFVEAPIANLSKLIQKPLVKAIIKIKSDKPSEKTNSNVETNEVKNGKINDLVRTNGKSLPYIYNNETFVNEENSSEVPKS
ncbi:O-acyltransferase like protein-like isoform X2 [Planococcus citri]|uniref:O-acyltransferase like protein-like isoform X2 n=1 Tax=Planococcus citri TaxID=170843 RepID=UPI0031FA0FE6